jgi:hypothetical protein
MYFVGSPLLIRITFTIIRRGCAAEYCLENPHVHIWGLSRGRIQRETWVWDPMLELTITRTYLIVDSEVQLSTPTMTNADDV